LFEKKRNPRAAIKKMNFMCIEIGAGTLPAERPSISELKIRSGAHRNL
jgi:hypothetical protein